MDFFKIRIASKDPQTNSAFQEAVSNLANHAITLDASRSNSPADLYVWDYDGNQDYPKELISTSPKQHVFVVNRSDVDSLRSHNRFEGVLVVLKPVNVDVLTAVLSEISEAGAASQRPPATLINGDQAGMLEYLLRANLRLQEYDQDRTKYLARLAHDFRAPLTAIGGYCGLLADGLLGPIRDSQADVLRRMQHSVNRLVRMASAMVDASAGRCFAVKPKLSPESIEQVIEQAVYEIQPFAQEKHIRITVDMERPISPLLFERTNIEQVVVNLLDNACKFVRKGGHIEIDGYPYFWNRRANVLRKHVAAERRRRESTQPNSYRVDVRDNGPGLDPALLDLLFEERTSSGTTSDRTGGGLGLVICRSIMELHDGRIWAEAPREGATFSFVLPYPTNKFGDEDGQQSDGSEQSEHSTYSGG